MNANADYVFAVAGMPREGNEDLYLQVTTALDAAKPPSPPTEAEIYGPLLAHLVSELAKVKRGESTTINTTPPA